MRTVGWLVGLSLLVGTIASAGYAAAESSVVPRPAAEPDAPPASSSFDVKLHYWLDPAQSLGLGLDVARIQQSVSARVVSPLRVAEPSVLSRVIDPSPNIETVSLGLQLRWPTLTGEVTQTPSALEPYVSIGPTLFVARPAHAFTLGLLPSQQEVSMAVGVLGSAGLSWRLSENASLFGEYRFMDSGTTKVGPFGGTGPFMRDADQSDLLYGISVRF
jgi:hypothetical protein